jgi:5-carboxymethyl-2-hydroxymuconate isomerase
MPHIIIEHSNTSDTNLNLKELSRTLHNYLAEQDSVKKVAIKTRTQLVENVIVGEDDQENRFIHITIKLLTGRPEGLRQAISENMFEKARAIIPKDFIVSLETRELGIYCK